MVNYWWPAGTPPVGGGHLLVFIGHLLVIYWWMLDIGDPVIGRPAGPAGMWSARRAGRRPAGPMGSHEARRADVTLLVALLVTLLVRLLVRLVVRLWPRYW